MTEEKFAQFILETELDPRPGFLRLVDSSTRRHLLGRPDDYIQCIVEPRLDALALRARELLIRGDARGLRDAIIEFDSGLERAVQLEDERRRPKSPDSVIAANAGSLHMNGWNAFEKHCLAELLEAGESLTGIGIRQVETSKGRTISRSDLNRTRPVTHRNDNSWQAQFTPEQVLSDLEHARTARIQ